MHFALGGIAPGLLDLSATPACAGEPDSSAGVLIPLKGDRAVTRLGSVSPQGDLTFDTGGSKRRMPAKDIIVWGSPVEPRSKVQLLLADGGMIPLEDAMPVTDGDRLLAFSDVFGNLTLPVKLLAGVMLHSPIDQQRRDELSAQILSKPLDEGVLRSVDNRDRLLLENGDELQGHIVALTDEGVQFEADVGQLTVERDRIIALAFDPSLRTKVAPSARSLVGFADGSVLSVISLKLGAGRTELILANGVTLIAGDAAPVFLQPLVGQVEYLSDRSPAGYRHVPYLDTAWDYRLDANVQGTRLRADGQIYAKGVGMHSASRLTWQLDKPYHRFQADLAIDDQTANRGSVVLRVFSGSREIFKSPTIRGGDKAVPMSIDIHGVRQLSLVVDYADRADVLDHADWLNARLVP